jgi:NAD(P)-dependent dehydrogenase (short-subunit alcohol dehydrogenase family)
VTERTAIVLGASADIGAAHVRRLAADGWSVLGTYRSLGGAADLEDLDGVTLVRCDIASPADIAALAACASEQAPWTLVISAVGRLDPVGPWPELDFDAWERSVRDNSTAQLRAVHALLPFRRPDGAHVAFFAGGGTNGPFRNYSAYCVAKVLLIKMCELLHDEVVDLNAFIVGPGFLPTKIHAPTLADPRAAGDNHAKTLNFYARPDDALSVDDVHDCVLWAVQQGRDVVGGRNIAAAHDPWGETNGRTARLLKDDPDAWRLRRVPLPSEPYDP